jgi:hypothetical protein
MGEKHAYKSVALLFNTLYLDFDSPFVEETEIRYGGLSNKFYEHNLYALYNNAHIQSQSNENKNFGYQIYKCRERINVMCPFHISKYLLYCRS